MTQAQVAYDAKDYAKSAELYERAYRLDPKLTTALYNEACSLALGGQKDRAFAALSELVDRGFNAPQSLRDDSDFASLREDPRWEKAVARAEENAKKTPPKPLWRPPYSKFPTPTDPAPYEARLGSAEDAVWQEGDTLSFLVRKKGDDVRLTGGLQQPMARIGDTDLWILQYRLPDWSKAIVSYGFVGGELKTGDSFKPRVWRGPDAPTTPEVETLKGQKIPCTIHSAALEEDRKFTVYLPPNAPKKGLPAFFVCDGAGEGFFKALEASILAGKTRPCAIVGIESGTYRGDRSQPYDTSKDDRGREYVPGVDDARFAQHLRFFVDEVGGYVAEHYGISRRREDRAVCGFSNGGAFAAAVAYRRPQAFGTAMPFSLGIKTEDPKPESPFPKMRFVAGTLETFSFATGQMFERMEAEGADATYEPYVAGHDYEMWTTAFGRLAPTIFPAKGRYSTVR